MKTTQYNPSPLEVAFVQVLEKLQTQITIEGQSIVKVVANYQKDNPEIIFTLQDADNDKHELLVKVIQRPDYN